MLIKTTKFNSDFNPPAQYKQNPQILAHIIMKVIIRLETNQKLMWKSPKKKEQNKRRWSIYPIWQLLEREIESTGFRVGEMVGRERNSTANRSLHRNAPLPLPTTLFLSLYSPNSLKSENIFPNLNNKMAKMEIQHGNYFEWLGLGDVKQWFYCLSHILLPTQFKKKNVTL